MGAVAAAGADTEGANVADEAKEDALGNDNGKAHTKASGCDDGKSRPPGLVGCAEMNEAQLGLALSVLEDGGNDMTLPAGFGESGGRVVADRSALEDPLRVGSTLGKLLDVTVFAGSCMFEELCDVALGGGSEICVTEVEAVPGRGGCPGGVGYGGVGNGGREEGGTGYGGRE